MKTDYNINRIMQEYNIKKKYEQKADIMEFKRNICNKCKNKYTNKCEIRRNIDGELNCQFKEM